jgi:hypothetical protein
MVAQRAVPSCHVLIDAVDERAIKVEDDRWLSHCWILAAVAWPKVPHHGAWLSTVDHKELGKRYVDETHIPNQRRRRHVYPVLTPWRSGWLCALLSCGSRVEKLFADLRQRGISFLLLFQRLLEQGSRFCKPQVPREGGK